MRVKEGPEVTEMACQQPPLPTPHETEFDMGRCTHVLVPWQYIPLATTRRSHITKFSRVFAFIIVLCFRGVFRGCSTRWNYPFSSIQLFLRRESQLPPASASVLVLCMLRVLRVLRVSVRCL